MHNPMLKGLERVNVIKAKRLFISGHIVTVVPHKMNPQNEWFNGSFIDPKDAPKHDLTTDAYFEEYVTQSTIYNCSYETGYYLAFYVEK